MRDRKGRVYEPAVSPRLKVLLLVVFLAVAVLGASGVYLAAITFLNWLRDPVTYTNQFTLWMFLIHVVVGVVIVGPFLYFGCAHFLSARQRKNRLAVKLGVALFLTGIIVCVTGLALIQLEGMPQLTTGTWSRAVVYALHVIVPVIAVGLYLWHRHAGPVIQWKYGYAWGGAVAVFTGALVVLHYQDPRDWYKTGSREGAQYFEPSKIRTPDATFIPAETLMMDEYCRKCHPDVFHDHAYSAHRFSSFNNPPYLFSVKETREVSLKRDGNVKASRWCAGCHDVVPFLSGQFDDPDYDIVNHPTAHAGITCTVCHAITNVDSTMGNAAFTIEEPQHYPFAYSENPLLQWVNNQMVKAKPDFHKKTFLKPFHKTAEFCSTCHKVSLPAELNHYKEWLRGQNHYDPFLLSGVSGGNARAFYYPEVAKANCAECHMPLERSNDFAARDFDGTGERKRHSHRFPGANTGLPWLLSLMPRHEANADEFRKAAEGQADFLRDKKLRIDLFGLRENGEIDGRLLPVRPDLPKLKPGQTYLIEVVIRTLNIGHVFPQGTADSNEIWVDVEARSGGRVIGRNGALYGPDETGPVDEWSHFTNALVLDRHGNRINRRNPQDIFTPFYDHQIPPGAAHVVHYDFTVPEGLTAPVDLRVRLRYRKFDFEYMSIVHEMADKPPDEQLKKVPKLPIIDLCEDRVTLPVENVAVEVPEQKSPIDPPWQRWNDYGIGYFLTATASDKKPGLLQAVQAFERMAGLYPDNKAVQAHAYLNLARCFQASGELDKAQRALEKIRADELPAPWWTASWFNGLVNAQNGHFPEAVKNFEEVLDPEKQDRKRKFDFSKDYVVRNELAKTLFAMSQQYTLADEVPERNRILTRAVKEYEATLSQDGENLEAHEGLRRCYERLGESAAPADVGAADLPEAEMEALGTSLADAGLSPEARVGAARKLGEAVAALGQRAEKAREPKLPVIKALTAQCRTVFHEKDADPQVRAAAAYVLGHLHREAHKVYKPDDNAKEMTAPIYRRKHPEAVNAEQAVKVYPLHRQGAPGL
jgi:tetratricopeptide (TPR) repeat protein